MQRRSSRGRGGAAGAASSARSARLYVIITVFFFGTKQIICVPIISQYARLTCQNCTLGHAMGKIIPHSTATFDYDPLCLSPCQNCTLGHAMRKTILHSNVMSAFTSLPKLHAWPCHAQDHPSLCCHLRCLFFCDFIARGIWDPQLCRP